MARKIDVKTILELLDMGISRNQIASSKHISSHSVSEVIRLAAEKHLSYRDVRDQMKDEVYKLFYPDKYQIQDMYRDPDYEYVHTELIKPGVTLKLLWEEYRDKCADEQAPAMGYTRFCEKYHAYTVGKKLTNHLHHKPGERIEVDWAGDTMRYFDPVVGNFVKVYLFVAALPYSRFSFAEATTDMKMQTFLRCHIHMFAYFGGSARILVCDNLKTGVVQHPKEGEIILTSEYEALGAHYSTAILPAGVREPRQKASVESAVGDLETAIIAKLRNETFYSLGELNKAVFQALEQYNLASFQKREGSRYDSFQAEQEYLQKLPDMPYEIATWVYGRKVNLDFHVIFEKNRYSCPYQYVQKEVDLRVTDTTVEIYYGHARIATHHRFAPGRKNQYSTHPEDMPDQFKVTPWDDERMKNWASSIGPNTRAVIDAVFRNVSIKEQGYNPSLSILRLSNKYTEERLENACAYALSHGISKPRYHNLNSILNANQDIVWIRQMASESEQLKEEELGYLRGEDYYSRIGR